MSRHYAGLSAAPTASLPSAKRPRHAAASPPRTPAATSPSYLLALPDELLCNVLRSLSAPELLPVYQCCRTLRRLVVDGPMLAYRLEKLRDTVEVLQGGPQQGEQLRQLLQRERATVGFLDAFSFPPDHHLCQTELQASVDQLAKFSRHLELLRIGGGAAHRLTFHGFATLRTLWIDAAPKLCELLCDLTALQSLCLDNFPCLQRLDLGGLPQLRVLQVQRCCTLGDLDIAGLQHLETVHLGGLLALRHLRLFDLPQLCRWSATCLPQLVWFCMGHLARLDHVGLQFAYNLQQVSLISCASLRQVSINFCANLQTLEVARLAQLVALNLDYSLGIDSLRVCQVPNLRHLGLHLQARLQHLTLEDCPTLQRVDMPLNRSRPPCYQVVNCPQLCGVPAWPSALPAGSTAWPAAWMPTLTTFRSPATRGSAPAAPGAPFDFPLVEASGDPDGAADAHAKPDPGH